MPVPAWISESLTSSVRVVNQLEQHIQSFSYLCLATVAFPPFKYPCTPPHFDSF